MGMKLWRFSEQGTTWTVQYWEKEVIVDDERLATALSRLPDLRREVLLLYYFLGYRDGAIGRLYGRCRSSINRRRNVALIQLRKEWEELGYPEQEADTFWSNRKSRCRGAGSGRGSVAALHRAHQISVYAQRAYQWRYTGQIKNKINRIHIEISLRPLRDSKDRKSCQG